MGCVTLFKLPVETDSFPKSTITDGLKLARRPGDHVTMTHQHSYKPDGNSEPGLGSFHFHCFEIGCWWQDFHKHHYVSLERWWTEKDKQDCEIKEDSYPPLEEFHHFRTRLWNCKKTQEHPVIWLILTDKGESPRSIHWQGHSWLNTRKARPLQLTDTTVVTASNTT